MATPLSSSVTGLPRILLVDDEKDNLDALRRLLRKNFEVTAVENGADALKAIAEEAPFDVLCSDQRMPGLSGVEFFEKARALDDKATRVLLTGFADMDAVVDAINRGQVWRYLSKPWEPDDLKQTLLQAAERTQLRRGLEISRQSLEQALLSLRATEWARERLFQILLHEFRTAPTILDAALTIEPLPESSTKLLNQLRSRFERLNSELTTWLEDGSQVQALPKVRVGAQEFFIQLTSSLGQHWPDPDQIPHTALLETPVSSLEKALVEVSQLLAQNTENLKPEFFCSLSIQRSPNFFFGWRLKSPTTLPKGLAGASSDPELAWRLLFEPFVGALPFEHHSQGLRLEATALLRRLAHLGLKSKLEVSTQIELQFSIHLIL